MLYIICPKSKDLYVLSWDLFDLWLSKSDDMLIYMSYVLFNYTENELHFVFFCPFYCEQRDALFSKIKTDIDLVNIDDANLSTDSLLYIHFL